MEQRLLSLYFHVYCDIKQNIKVHLSEFSFEKYYNNSMHKSIIKNKASL